MTTREKPARPQGTGRLRRGLGAAVLAVILLTAAPAWAGVIKLSTTAGVATVAGKPVLQLTLANRGDDSAHDLEITARLGRRQVVRPGPARLAPNASARLEVPLPAGPATPGDYPVLITVVFHNAHGHRFSNIAVGIFSRGAPAANPLRVRGQDAAITTIGKMRFNLVSSTPHALAVTTRVFTPFEFAAADPRQELRLAGPGRRHLAVELRNRSAFDHASYPVFLIAEFDHQGRHYTSLASALVSVRPQGDPMAPWRAPLAAAAALLLLIIIGAQLMPGRARQGA